MDSGTAGGPSAPTALCGRDPFGVSAVTVIRWMRVSSIPPLVPVDRGRRVAGSPCGTHHPPYIDGRDCGIYALRAGATSAARRRSGGKDVVNHDSLQSLTGTLRYAVVDLLYRMADDELMISHCDTEWSAAPPVSDAYAALPIMDRQERAHAQRCYEHLHELGETSPADLVLRRPIRSFRCASLVCLPTKDRPFGLVRRFLYDAQENVRVMALCHSSLTPLADLAESLRGPEREHLEQTRRWLIELGQTDEGNFGKLSEVLAFLYPQALGLFEPTGADVPLAASGICPSEGQLLREWESAVVPVLSEIGWAAPANLEPAYGGRVGRHPRAFESLLESVRRSWRQDVERE